MKRLLVLASIATMGVSGTAFGQSGVNEANLMQKKSAKPKPLLRIRKEYQKQQLDYFW